LKKLFVLTVIGLSLAGFARADIYIKSNTHTDAVSMMGQSRPASDVTTEQWLGDGVMASKMGDRATLVNLKTNKIYIINNADKTYVEGDLPLDFSKLLPPQMAGMMGGMKMTVTVTPNGQTKQIGQWACTGYDAAMTMMGMPMKMAIWATKDVPFDFKSFMSKMYVNLLKSQMMMDDDAAKEMMKVDGFWVATDMTMNMMGAKSHVSTEVTEIAQKPAPAGTYDLPAGYQKTDTLSMKDLQKR
jgi:hypothetical protein